MAHDRARWWGRVRAYSWLLRFIPGLQSVMVIAALGTGTCKLLKDKGGFCFRRPPSTILLGALPPSGYIASIGGLLSWAECLNDGRDSSLTSQKIYFGKEKFLKLELFVGRDIICWKEALGRCCSSRQDKLKTFGRLGACWVDVFFVKKEAEKR